MFITILFLKNYLIPCISFFNQKLKKNNTIPMISGMYTSKLKKSDNEELF